MKGKRDPSNGNSDLARRLRAIALLERVTEVRRLAAQPVSNAMCSVCSNGAVTTEDAVVVRHDGKTPGDLPWTEVVYTCRRCEIDDVIGALNRLDEGVPWPPQNS